MLKQSKYKLSTIVFKKNSISFQIPKFDLIYLDNSYKNKIGLKTNFNQFENFSTHKNSSYDHKSNPLYFLKITHKTLATSNITKKHRVSDTNFLSDSNSNFLFQETKLNKSLLFFFGMVHIPFYLVSINLGFGLNLIQMDLVRTGLKTLPLFQAIITGINISSIINEIQVKFENFKNNKNFELNSEEVKKEIADSEKWIILSSFPLLINFAISQILVNFVEISKEVLILCSFGFFASNSANLFVLFYFVYKRNFFNSQKSSLLKINLIFALLSLLSYMLMISYLFKKECGKRNPFLSINDENRIENLKTINEYAKDDTKMVEVEISQLMEEITPEQIELLEKIFEEEK